MRRNAWRRCRERSWIPGCTRPSPRLWGGVTRWSSWTKTWRRPEDTRKTKPGAESSPGWWPGEVAVTLRPRPNTARCLGAWLSTPKRGLWFPATPPALTPLDAGGPQMVAPSHRRLTRPRTGAGPSRCRPTDRYAANRRRCNPRVSLSRGATVHVTPITLRTTPSSTSGNPRRTQPIEHEGSFGLLPKQRAANRTNAGVGALTDDRWMGYVEACDRVAAGARSVH